MNEKKDEKSIKERVESITLRKFWISDCPEEVYQRFVDFCKKETNNGYAMGIKLLLDAWEKNAIELMLYEKIIALEDWRDMHIAQHQNKKKNKIKTLGKRNEKGEEE